MKKLKVIMIDAFKPSYLEHAPYLRSLTEKNSWGELEMGVGHWRPVEILFKGKSNTLAIFYKNNEGSLNYLRYFRWLGKLGKFGRLVLDVLFNFPRMIKGYELFRTGNIPIERLGSFDVAVKKHVGKEHDFTYFGELDRLGHKYGTKSQEVIDAIREVDKKISERDFDLIFSDHGMVDIKKKVRVPITKNCFIDSDIARYWGEKEELERIRRELPLEEGEIIEWDERFGQLIFLANTGNLIFPNFWDKNEVKAMHGYDGKDRDMLAFYIFNEKGERKDLNARELHEKLKEYGKDREI